MEMQQPFHRDHGTSMVGDQSAPKDSGAAGRGRDWVKAIARETKNWAATWHQGEAADFTSDAERLARLGRKRAACHLNHPHMARITVSKKLTRRRL